MANAVDTVVHAVQTPRRGTLGNRLLREPEVDQLPCRDDRLLTTGKRSDRRIQPARAGFHNVWL